MAKPKMGERNVHARKGVSPEQAAGNQAAQRVCLHGRGSLNKVRRESIWRAGSMGSQSLSRVRRAFRQENCLTWSTGV